MTREQSPEIEKNKMIMTRLEIIDETAAFYNLKNRSVDSENDDNCLYNGPDGKHCAFARMVIDPSTLRKFEGTSAHHILTERVSQDTLKPEYRGHAIQFYRAIQSLHDNRLNWNDEGLSEHGQQTVLDMKQKWA